MKMVVVASANKVSTIVMLTCWVGDQVSEKMSCSSDITC